MREIRPSGSEGGGAATPLSLPLSPANVKIFSGGVHVHLSRARALCAHEIDTTRAPSGP